LSALLAFKSRQARNDFNLLRSNYLQHAPFNLTGQHSPWVMRPIVNWCNA
jgi:hypothetical protein